MLDPLPSIIKIADDLKLLIICIGSVLNGDQFEQSFFIKF